MRYKVLHSFGYGSDGVYPEASLIDVAGTLYGTTYVGGKYNRGTVFSLTPRGVEKVLHNFGSGNDGANPSASLIDVDGTLYGTTYHGGAYGCYTSYSNCGTVFSIAPSGTEKVLHSFGREGENDGEFPASSLINVNGTLYGTTSQGGAYYTAFCGDFCGTVFAITKTGTETVLHNFKSGSGDGGTPQAGLTNVKGTLYGTTSVGGEYRGGTAFSITLSGVEKVLHSFGQGTDGDIPDASLINVNGRLYGTTVIGGVMSCRGVGTICGTVFSITPGGVSTEKVLHEFSGRTDGGNPFAPLIDVQGTLYGTTAYGGAYGSGTVFSVTTGGTERVLHSFLGAPGDGGGPDASLLEVNGTLYGTTEFGGANSGGTVFRLTP